MVIMKTEVVALPCCLLLATEFFILSDGLHDSDKTALRLMPNFTGCVVHHWDYLTCTWEPSATEQEHETALQITHQLHWNIGNDSCVVDGGCESYLCPHLSPGRCEWRYSDRVKHPFEKDQVYTMFLTVSYTSTDSGMNGSVIGEPAVINSKNIVKPRPPYGIYAVIKQWEFTIEWTKDHKAVGRQLLDLLVVKQTSEPRGPLFKYEWIDYVNNSTVFRSVRIQRMGGSDIKDLQVHPYTTYNATLWSTPYMREKQCGFWSNPTSIQFTTKSDVPGKLPMAQSGMFYRMKTSHVNRQLIDVYWNHIPRLYMHGAMKNILIHYVFDHTTAPVSCHCPPHRCENVTYDADVRFVQLRQTHPNRTYYVYLEGENSKGCNADLLNSARPSIIINGKRNVGRLEYFAVRRNKTASYLHLSWKPLKGEKAIKKYTLYWCKVKTTGDFKTCKTDIKWKTLDGGATTHIHDDIDSSTDAALTYQFAISSEVKLSTGVATSGLVFAECITDMALDIATPTLAPVRHQEPEKIRIAWKKPHRCRDSAYILEYEVKYAPLHNKADYKLVKVKAAEEQCTLHGLEGGEKYHVAMRSISPWQQSEFMSLGIFTAQKRSFAVASGITVVLMAVGTVCFLLAALGASYAIRTCSREMTGMKKGVRIVLPDDKMYTTPNNETRNACELKLLHDNAQHHVNDRTVRSHDRVASPDNTTEHTTLLVETQGKEDTRFPALPNSELAYTTLDEINNAEFCPQEVRNGCCKFNRHPPDLSDDYVKTNCVVSPAKFYTTPPQQPFCTFKCNDTNHNDYAFAQKYDSDEDKHQPVSLGNLCIELKETTRSTSSQRKKYLVNNSLKPLLCSVNHDVHSSRTSSANTLTEVLSPNESCFTEESLVLAGTESLSMHVINAAGYVVFANDGQQHVVSANDGQQHVVSGNSQQHVVSGNDVQQHVVSGNNEQQHGDTSRYIDGYTKTRFFRNCEKNNVD